MLTIEYFQKYQDQIVTLLQDLIAMESPSEDKAAVDRMGQAVLAAVRPLAPEIQVFPRSNAGDVFVARWNAAAGGEPILLLCHMDTVFPVGLGLKQNPIRVEDGKCFGPGALDMKGGIAIALTVLDVLQRAGQMPERPVTALFTTDEETGSLASRAVIEELARQSALVLCLEPSMADGSLKTWRKGVGDFMLQVYGRAAHAGAAHAEGRNAIEELAHQILAIQKMTDYERGTTVNVGIVQGGTAGNVVPAEARAEIDVRVMQSEEAARILQQLQALQPALAGTRLSISGGLNRPPMPRDERMVATFQRVQALAAQIGLALTEDGTGGGSDANFVAPLGVAVLDGLGGRGEGQHSEREFVWVDSLVERSALLAAILQLW